MKIKQCKDGGVRLTGSGSVFISGNVCNNVKGEVCEVKLKSPIKPYINRFVRFIKYGI